MTPKLKEFSQSFFHGTKARLRPGDQIIAGYQSNYDEDRRSRYVYFTSNLNIAIWGAELALGEAQENIYIVEPVGTFEDDPNVTNKRFPGNPTNSYRTSEALIVVGFVTGWQGHSQAEIEARKEGLRQLKLKGAQIIED